MPIGSRRPSIPALPRCHSNPFNIPTLFVVLPRTSPNGGHTSIFQYELVDTVTGESQVLVDAPIPSSGSEMAWSADSQSVVVSNAYLPLNVDDPAAKTFFPLCTIRSSRRLACRTLSPTKAIRSFRVVRAGTQS